MPKRPKEKVKTLYCFKCFKWVEGRNLSGGYYCPNCSSYLQIKNQPPPYRSPSSPATTTPGETPPSQSTSGGSSGASRGGNRGK